MNARYIDVEITYNGVNITTDIKPFLKSLSYTDAMSGQADDLQIVLEDIEGIWQSGWLPEMGATLIASITARNWDDELSPTVLLGSFEIDEITSSGYPSEVCIKAVSVPFENTLRGEEHTRSWEQAELKTIANDISSSASMELFYDTEDNPVISHAEQSEQSDLSFLLSLCNEYCLALKVSNGKIVIFDECKYEEGEAVITLVKPGYLLQKDAGIFINSITRYSFSCKLRDVYAACHVKYQKSDTKEVIEATFKAPEKNGKTLQVREQVDNLSDAERLAKKRLRERNKDEVVGTIGLVGNVLLMAGTCVNIVGFGVYDGKYIITEANHEVGGAYTTEITVRRCLNGY